MATKKGKKKTPRKTRPAQPEAGQADPKADKFVELAEKRATKAINSIRQLTRLSNKNNYHYTSAQTKQICDALKAEVIALHDAFNKQTGAAKVGFSFKSAETDEPSV